MDGLDAHTLAQRYRRLRAALDAAYTAPAWDAERIDRIVDAMLPLELALARSLGGAVPDPVPSGGEPARAAPGTRLAAGAGKARDPARADRDCEARMNMQIDGRILAATAGVPPAAHVPPPVPPHGPAPVPPAPPLPADPLPPIQEPPPGENVPPVGDPPQTPPPAVGTGTPRPPAAAEQSVAGEEDPGSALDTGQG